MGPRVPSLNDNRRSTYRGSWQKRKQMIVKTLVGLDYSCAKGSWRWTKIKKKKHFVKILLSLDSTIPSFKFYVLL